MRRGHARATLIAGLLALAPAGVAGAEDAPTPRVVVYRLGTNGAVEERWASIFLLAMLAPESGRASDLAFWRARYAVPLDEVDTPPGSLANGRVLVERESSGTLSLVSRIAGTLHVSRDLAPGSADDYERDCELPIPAEGLELGEVIGALLGRKPSASAALVAAVDADRLTGGGGGRGAALARALSRRLESSADAMRTLAQVELARGQPERALESARAAVERDPRDPFLHVLVGDAAERLGAAVEAGASFDRAAELAEALGDTLLAARARGRAAAIAEFRRADAERRAGWAAARADVIEQTGALAAGRQQRRVERRAEETRLAERLSSSRPDQHVDAALELVELHVSERLYSKAMSVLRAAHEQQSESLRLRSSLARVLLLDDEPVRAAAALASDLLLAAALRRGDVASAIECHVRRGDAALARASAAWEAQRWWDIAGPSVSTSLELAARLRAPGPDESSREMLWDQAGQSYRRALAIAEAYEGPAIAEPRRVERLAALALARLADWQIARGELDEARATLARVNDEARRDVPDLLRVEASLAHAQGDSAQCFRRLLDFANAVAREADTILAFARALESMITASDVEQPGDAGNVEEREHVAEGAPGGSASDESAARLESLRGLVERGIKDEPAHIGLRVLRARIDARLGHRTSTRRDLRFAIIAGESAWKALESSWLRSSLGPRSGRPPERPRFFSSESSLPGAPSTVTEFVRLRIALARSFLAATEGVSVKQGLADEDAVIAARIALLELRPVEAFLEREEARLRSARLARDDVEWETELTRPERVRYEPVDFGNTRHRVLWAELRLASADALARAGDTDVAARVYAWVARSLAVRKSSVVRESRWQEELRGRERAIAARALMPLAGLTRRDGDDSRARGLERLARGLLISR